MGFKRLEPSKSSQEVEPSAKRFRKIEPSQKGPEKQSKIESVLSAGAKGLIRGGKELGKLHDPISAFISGISKKNDKDIDESVLESTLPSKEGFSESLAERTGRMAPGFALGPGRIASKAGSLIGGALSGQLAEESGANPWLQAGAEVLGSILGGSPSGALRPRAGSRQEQLINTARGHGLSEAEIAPAIQSQNKIGFLSPIAHRGQGTVGRIFRSRNAIGRIFNNLSNSAEGQQARSPEELAPMLNDISQELQNLPNPVRDLIARDAQDMISGPGNAASIMNFYQDVNYQIGRGNGHLGGVRRILERYLTNFLGDDFTAANELYTNNRRLGIRIRPDLSSHFHDFRNAADLSSAIVDGNKKGIISAVTQILSRFTASKSLVSPYMQHIPQKIIDSALLGNVESAKKILTIMLNKNDEKESSREKLNHTQMSK